jgi:hypothetical protein
MRRAESQVEDPGAAVAADRRDFLFRAMSSPAGDTSTQRAIDPTVPVQAREPGLYGGSMLIDRAGMHFVTSGWWKCGWRGGILGGFWFG